LPLKPHLLPEDIRRKKIEWLEQILEKMKGMSKRWSADYEQIGVKAQGQFSITCIDFMVELVQEWLKTERELLELEIAFQRLSKARRKAPKKGKKSKST
jgi:hypothetical protein